MREEAGISQRELSRRLHANETLIARIERGERTVDLVEFIDIMRAVRIEPIAGFHRLLKEL